MEEDYVILHSYILKLDFDSPIPPEKFVTADESDYIGNQSNEIKFSVEYQKKSGLFYVDVHVICHIQMANNIDVFNLSVVYRGLVAVNFSLEDKEINECLKIKIPQELYESVREIIYSVTEYSGFPAIKMEEYSFKDNCLK